MTTNDSKSEITKRKSPKGYSTSGSANSVKAKKLNKGGRPQVAVNWEEFSKLCYMHATKEEICNWFKLSDSTLTRAVKRKYKISFEDLYKKESVQGRVSLRRAQFQAAENGNTTMLIWLGKQWLGQKDQIKTDVTNKGRILEAIDNMLKE